MRVRFLTAIATSRWTYPAGAVIAVERLTPQLQTWLTTGVLELVRDESPETAVLPQAPEHAITRRRPRRKSVPAE